MQQLSELYHNTGIDIAEVGCTLAKLANICLNQSKDSKFYPFTETDKDMLEKIRQVMVGEPSTVFTSEAIVNKTFISTYQSTNQRKFFVGIDDSQHYTYSLSQPTPTGLYTRWEYDSETQRFTPCHNKPGSFENMVFSCFQRTRPACRKGIVLLIAQEKANTKWKFYKIMNIKNSASLLKDIPIGCKDTVLPEPISKSTKGIVLLSRGIRQPYNENLCLLRAPALYLHGNDKLEEETAKILKLFPAKSEERDPSNIHGFQKNHIPNVADNLQLNIFLYYRDFVDGEFIGQLARTSIQKKDKSVKLLRYSNHIRYVSNINAFFKDFRCSVCDILFQNYQSSKTFGYFQLTREIYINEERLRV